MADKRKIKVFIASPGDLAVERRAFKTVIDELNKGFGDGAGVEFVALGWEDVLATVTRRPQDLINKNIDACDVFLLVMHRRWGQSYAGDPAYSSYTEEEFYRAFTRYEKTKAPAMVVLFKRVDAASEADPGEQLKKVLDFRKRLESCVLYHSFDDEAGFTSDLDRHLRAFARGEFESTAPSTESIPIPSGLVDKLAEAELAAKQEAEKAEQERRKADAAAARADEFALIMAQRAAKAALEGRLEEARQDLAKAAEGTRNLDILYLAFKFYLSTGDLAEAERIMESWLAISGPDLQIASTAVAYGNLGLIYDTRGDLDRAEEMHRKALEIDEKLGNEEGIARHSGNLGLIYRTRGDLDRAEEMHRKALEIDEKLGNEEGIAGHSGNLGLIYQIRGDLDRAEELHYRSIGLYEDMGVSEKTAPAYVNLGLIFENRDELDRAEEMYLKALRTFERLGRQRDIAASYLNLGWIHQRRRALDTAEELYKQSAAICESHGFAQTAANTYSNLGTLYRDRDDLDQAERMFRRALEFDRQSGGLEHCQVRISNLAGVIRDRGDLLASDELFHEAIRLGWGGERALPEYLANLGANARMRGDIDGARSYWTNARDQFADLKMQALADKLQDRLDRLPATA